MLLIVYRLAVNGNNICVGIAFHVACLNRLAVNGNDLKSLGYKGIEIKKKLDYVLDLVIKGKINTTVIIQRPILLSITKSRPWQLSPHVYDHPL